METSAATAPPSEPFPRIAHPLHTIVVIAAEAFLVVRAAMHVDQLRATAELHRIRIYERTMLAEWIAFGFVLLGVWLAGSPLATVLGTRWRSVRDALQDIGIGVAFSIVTTILLSIFLPHASGGASERSFQFLLPQGRTEMAMWIALSLSAGICEETLYRGYLQRQFIALTKNVPAGILISGVAFGLAHAYQGPRMAFVIGIEGLLLGALAHWRGSVRPGMIAHSFKDSLAPLLIAAMKH